MNGAKSSSPAERFTLARGSWYGWTMYPGYGDYPYHSPIRVDEITPLGGRKFRLRFLNARYAVGVQDFKKVLRTLHRSQSHLVAQEAECEDRSVVIMPLTRNWFDAQLPKVDTRELFSASGQLIPEAVSRRFVGCLY